MNTFSGGAMIRFGWETFKKRPWFFIGVFLVVSILSSGGQFQTGKNIDYTPATIILLVVVSVAFAAIQILAKMGSIQFVLKAHNNSESTTFGDLWAPHPFWKFVGGSILVGVIVIIGFILLIVPGIIWGLRYMFVPYLVVERKLKPFEALKESARITYGHKWQLLGLLCLIVLINILGALFLLVGLLVSIPVSSLAMVHAYRTLAGQASPAQTQTPAAN
ncbi:MAG: hypothetical protein Q7R90_01650 [bacterium]|nr:hypothetical protein [bacterium]